MDKAFICSAFSGDTEQNTIKAREYCRWAAMECGVIPIAPHLLFPQFLDDENPQEREHGIQMGLELLADCKQFFYFGDTITPGMVTEITKAYDLNIPTRHVSGDELKEYLSIGTGEMHYE